MATKKKAKRKPVKKKASSYQVNMRYPLSTKEQVQSLADRVGCGQSIPEALRAATQHGLASLANMEDDELMLAYRQATLELKG